MYAYQMEMYSVLDNNTLTPFLSLIETIVLVRVLSWKTLPDDVYFILLLKKRIACQGGIVSSREMLLLYVFYYMFLYGCIV